MSNGQPAALVVPATNLDRAVDAAETAGFRLDATGPADEPTWAELSQGDVTLVVDTSLDPAEGPRSRPSTPGEHGATLEVPPTVASHVVSHQDGDDWKIGRAGMRYRDLIPDRYGGAYIASHIHVPDGGPVPDYVHHHDIVHQLIFCHRGWAKVVYQDQGPPLTMEPGDCILQPPGIRHQVLETSPEFYVVEVGCPAAHRTSLDHDLALPTPGHQPDRLYGGQRFVHHRAAEAPWQPADSAGVLSQDTGLDEASGGLVSVHRHRGDPLALDLTNEDDLRLIVVTDGSATLTRPDGSTEQLDEGSSATITSGAGYRIDGASADTIILDVRSAQPSPA